MAKARLRGGGRTPHRTLTRTAERAARALQRAGLSPYPGLINPARSRAAPRATVVVERGRVRVIVSGEGVQEILLYGAAGAAAVLAALRAEFGGAVAVRDPDGLWPAAG